MEQSQRPVDRWLGDLVATMEHVTSTAEDPDAADYRGLLERLQLPTHPLATEHFTSTPMRQSGRWGRVA